MIKKISILVLFVFGFLAGFSQEIPKRPDPPTMVTDFANVLQPDEKASLEKKLVDFFAATSTQIAIVTVPDLGGTEVSDFAFKLGEAWGIGNAKFDNGILILLKPSNAEGKGKIFIAVGYGLEGVVPDATTKQIIETEIIPRLKQGDFYGGMNQATTVLIELTKGEYNYKQYAKGGSSKKGGSIIAVLVVLFIIISLFRGRGNNSNISSAGSSLPFWLALGMLSGRGGGGGSFGDFSGGGGSFGGFGGFGGGSFGGGGAGGSWD